MQLHGLDSNELQISLDLPILDKNIFCFIYGAICLENIHMAKVVRADETNLLLSGMWKDCLVKLNSTLVKSPWKHKTTDLLCMKLGFVGIEAPCVHF